jgi:hypothetical protein
MRHTGAQGERRFGSAGETHLRPDRSMIFRLYLVFAALLLVLLMARREADRTAAAGHARAAASQLCVRAADIGR